MNGYYGVGIFERKCLIFIRPDERSFRQTRKLLGDKWKFLEWGAVEDRSNLNGSLERLERKVEQALDRNLSEVLEEIREVCYGGKGKKRYN